jgi:hypothetical protein
MSAEGQKEAVEQILDKLTEKLYFHAYPIFRTEARDYVGLNVVFADGELATALWELYTLYKNALKLGEAAIDIDPSRGGRPFPLEVEAAVVESEAGFHTFALEGMASVKPGQGKAPPSMDVQLKGSWRKRA